MNLRMKNKLKKVTTFLICWVAAAWNVLELATNWIVVAVTAERLVAIRFPLKARIICRRRNTAVGESVQ